MVELEASPRTNISLARGAPSLDIIAVDDLRAAAQNAFERDPAGTFAYGTSAGYPHLLEWIAAKHGVEPDRLIATNGSMQADAFLFQTLVKPGDLVVVEAPTYDRTLLALRELGAEILAIPLEADGIDVAALEVALNEGARPKLAHIIPNFQNPAGCTLSLEKRTPAARAGGRARLHDLRGRPVRGAALRGRAAAHDALARTRPNGGLRVLVLEDGLPWHPRRLPGRPGRPDRRHPQARHQHLHLAEHGRPVDRRRVLPLRRDRALDRDRQGGPAGAPRRHGERARAPPAGRQAS